LISKDGKLLGRGHNLRVQKGSPIHHVSALLLNSDMLEGEDLTGTGGNISSRELRATSCVGLPGSYYVHDAQSLWYVWDLPGYVRVTQTLTKVSYRHRSMHSLRHFESGHGRK
jgi:hypothetical protein